MLLALGSPEFRQKPAYLSGHSLWRMDRHEMSGLDDPKSCRVNAGGDLHKVLGGPVAIVTTR